METKNLQESAKNQNGISEPLIPIQSPPEIYAEVLQNFEVIETKSNRAKTAQAFLKPDAYMIPNQEIQSEGEESDIQSQSILSPSGNKTENISSKSPRITISGYDPTDSQILNKDEEVGNFRSVQNDDYFNEIENPQVLPQRELVLPPGRRNRRNFSFFRRNDSINKKFFKGLLLVLTFPIWLPIVLGITLFMILELVGKKLSVLVPKMLKFLGKLIKSAAIFVFKGIRFLINFSKIIFLYVWTILAEFILRPI